MSTTSPARSARRAALTIIAAVGSALLGAAPAFADSLDAANNGVLGETVAINTCG